jgi:UDP-N-acetylmuramate--alanine ligase
LNYLPNIVILTSLEEDHLDYYHDADDLEKAFFEFLDKVPSSGHIIYCADDKGTQGLIDKFHGVKPGLHLIPYGRNARGNYKLLEHRQSQGRNSFRLAGFKEIFHLPLPGYHVALDASAAIALTELLLNYDGLDLDASKIDCIKNGLSRFRGSKRRSEIIGEAGGILFLDDYAHHPTAIKTTLRGYREYYPDRRLVVDFMSHTYSRTQALLDDFAEAFSDADEVILHEIYASAREENRSGISGERLYREVLKNHPSVRYYPGLLDAKDYCHQSLESGDIFVTMGAGDNWKLGKVLFEELQNEEGE